MREGPSNPAKRPRFPSFESSIAVTGMLGLRRDWWERRQGRREEGGGKRGEGGREGERERERKWRHDTP